MHLPLHPFATAVNSCCSQRYPASIVSRATITRCIFFAKRNGSAVVVSKHGYGKRENFSGEVIPRLKSSCIETDSVIGSLCERRLQALCYISLCRLIFGYGINVGAVVNGGKPGTMWQRQSWRHTQHYLPRIDIT